jgi:Transmembrane amino acid transporter protein
VDAIVMAVIVGTLSLVPDMGYLAKASASGLFILGLIFIILATYSFTSKDNQETTSAYDTQITFPWHYLWPQDNMSGISNWFGCVVFGFGVVPLTYNFQESMSRPQELTHATAVALLGVAVSYIVLGCGLLALYHPVQGDILEQFPTQGILPLVVRLSMIVVIVLTSPLLVLPCGKILEEKLSMLSSSFHNHKLMQAIMRYGLCTICAIISVFIPGFVYILSFVGCFSVALVGFVIPPMIHISLVMKYHPSPKPIGQLCLDVAMLLWGIVATIISSLYTFRKLF